MNLNPLLTVESVFIIMLIVISWQRDSNELFQCSRDRSKIVRDVIHKKFIPIFLRHEISLSRECPFHPDREFLWWPIYAEEKLHNDNVDNHFWTCPFCGTRLYCRDSLISHWDQEHRYSQLYREDQVCLADYCGIFRCDIIMKRMVERKKLFLNYLSLVQSNSIENHKCDPEQMDFLQEMCLNVIQQCTIGIEINISSQTIWTLRKELSDSLCSYLTCEHYNDDLFPDETNSRKVPIILFSTFGFIMLSGFFLLYYLIWNIFKRRLINEKEEKVVSIKKGDIYLGKRKDSNGPNHNSSSLSSNKFFQNIFEFHHEKNEDTFEYDDFDMSQVSKFEAKLHAINSIIEEEEEESEIDLSINSYPNLSRRHAKKNLSRPQIPPKHDIEPNADVKKVKEKFRKSQEICFQELPMKFHSKYIQPVKHSYSDQYPCYTGPMSESFTMLSRKSRSYSHSHLKDAKCRPNVKLYPNNSKRQQFFEESNSLREMRSSAQFNPNNKQNFALKLADNYNGRQRISRSAMSYHMMHPSKRREIYAASKTNSDASIASGSSRYTVHSNPLSFNT